MNSNSEYPDFREYKTPRKRRLFFYSYLLVFGVLIGVVLTNTFRPSGKHEPYRDTSSSTADSITESRSKPVITSLMLTDYEKAVIAAIERVKPAVVTIYSSGVQYYRFRNPIYDMFYGLQSKERTAMGSGVIIDSMGTIITNQHVINPAKEENPKIKVELPGGRIFDAEIVKDFPDPDIAILSINSKNLPYVEIGSSANVVQGQTVLAIGNPFGVSQGGEQTVTRGIISATKRNLIITVEGETKYFRKMIQTDASINEGNSGGPLIDLNGRMIGINTAIISEGAGSVGLGFAIPSDRVKLILDLIEKQGGLGEITIGIKVQMLTGNLANVLQFKGDRGVIISEIEPGSPGEKGGFKKGDIITGVDGYGLSSIGEIRTIFKGAVPGDVYELRVFRDGEYLDLPLTIGSK